MKTITEENTAKTGAIVKTIMDTWHKEIERMESGRAEYNPRLKIDLMAKNILSDYQYESKQIEELKHRIWGELEEKANKIGDIKNNFEIILNSYYDFLTDEICDEIIKKVIIINNKEK